MHEKKKKERPHFKKEGEAARSVALTRSSSLSISILIACRPRLCAMQLYHEPLLLECVFTLFVTVCRFFSFSIKHGNEGLSKKKVLCLKHRVQV